MDTGVSPQPSGTLKLYRGISVHPTPWPPAPQHRGKEETEEEGGKRFRR
jgi:hypothetical protein